MYTYSEDGCRGSACAAKHGLSDSIVFPNKHRHPFKWNKHRQRAKGTGGEQSDVMFVLDLQDGTVADPNDMKRHKERGES